jgi:hypothetical protein
MKFDRVKFKRLVHHVVWKTGGREDFGAVELNKVLWFSEARHFMLHGKPITGAVYIRDKFGPVPKAMMLVRKELEDEKAIHVWEDRRDDHPQTRFEALDPPDISDFSKDERQAVDWCIEHSAKKNAAQATSDRSWEIAATGEEIPFHALLARRIRHPDDKEAKRLAKQVKELGLR